MRRQSTFVNPAPTFKMEEFIRNLTFFKFTLYSLVLALFPILLIMIFFRNLLFKSSFNYQQLESCTPDKKNVLTFLNYQWSKEQNKFFLQKMWNDFFYKDRIVFVAGEASPNVYDNEFYDKVNELKCAGYKLKVIAGPILLSDNGESYLINAANDDLLDLFIPEKRIGRHFRANLFTGELYYEQAHEPNQYCRKAIHFDENRFEVKHYLRIFEKMLKHTKKFNLNNKQDYCLVSKDELENIKNCVKLNGKKFNDCSLSEIRGMLTNGTY